MDGEICCNSCIYKRLTLLTGLQLSMETPRGMRMAARAMSTMAWWKSSPCDHLRREESSVLRSMMVDCHTQVERYALQEQKQRGEQKRHVQ